MLVIRYSKRFLKDLAEIPSKQRKHIEKFVFEESIHWKSSTEILHLEKLKGYTTYYKIRFGDYRVGVELKDKELHFLRVLHREKFIVIFHNPHKLYFRTSLQINYPLIVKPTVFSTLYRKIIFSLLNQFTEGRLTLTLPDGKIHTFGDGVHPQRATIQITNDTFFKHCVLYGDIGFGEAYMTGDWTTDNITDVIKWMILNVENSPAMSGGNSAKKVLFNVLNIFNKWYHTARPNTVSGSRKNIGEHYDLGNDFYKLWLDPSLTYSSALFNEPNLTLEQAQYQKYDRLCQQLKLKPSDHLLEIGSGWGGFSVFAAKNYGCKITTITISQEQFKYARERFERENLSHKIDILLEDYRKITGKFDKIVSIEMLEAVGHKYLPIYFKKCQELLTKDGMLALQVIISPDSRYKQLRKGVDWIQKHIFPGSLLPSVSAINTAINTTGDMTLYDLKEMGQNYAHTLAHWRDNFNEKLVEVKAQGFSDQFIRKWNYYLSYCEAAFAMRNINVVQMVYARPNNSVI